MFPVHNFFFAIMSHGTPATPKHLRSTSSLSFSPSSFSPSSRSPGTPRKRSRVDVQRLAFLYHKKEKDAAILKLRESMGVEWDYQGIFRATCAIISVVLGVSQENGAYAKLVMDNAREMLFGPDPRKHETDLGNNLKAAVGMIRADHNLGGWTTLRCLATCAAANRGPAALQVQPNIIIINHVGILVP